MKRIFAVLFLLAFSTSVMAQSLLFNYTRVYASNGTTNTRQVSIIPGVLHTVIEGPTAGNFQILDKASGCSAVPSGDSSIIVDGLVNYGASLEIDARFLNGLCVVVNSNVGSPASVTVTWQ